MTPASRTLTFYSISRPQVNALIDILKKGGATVTDDKIEGPTPAGDVKADWWYNQGSGQLTVVVTDKPFVVGMETIESHLKDQLAQASVDVARAEAAKANRPKQNAPVPPSVPPTVPKPKE